MDYIDTLQEQKGQAFSFDNVLRNDMMEGEIKKKNGFTSTGTTISGLICLDEKGNQCVVLGADTRATNGPVVADKKCMKLHNIQPKIWAAGAGTAADLEHQTDEISQKTKLFYMNMAREPRVTYVVNNVAQKLYQYQGHVGAYLIIGGVDPAGAHLHMVHAHGSTDSLPYMAMGSGSLAAMAMLERGYTDNMPLEEGANLVKQAIMAGVNNDLGSGTMCNLVIIRKDKDAELRMGLDEVASKKSTIPPVPQMNFEKGATTFIKEDIRKLVTITDGDVEMA